MLIVERIDPNKPNAPSGRYWLPNNFTHLSLKLYLILVLYYWFERLNCLATCADSSHLPMILCSCGGAKSVIFRWHLCEWGITRGLRLAECHWSDIIDFKYGMQAKILSEASATSAAL
jgi:hypothetical protein